MKKILMGVVAAAAMATVGCQDKAAQDAQHDVSSEVQQEQRELESATQDTYDTAEDRAAAIEQEQQDVREQVRENMDEREDAFGGAADEGSVGAEELNTQELPEKQ